MDKRSEWRMNKRTSGSILLAAAVLALPIGATAAEGLSYGFIEVQYINLDVDEPGDRVFDRDFDDGGGWGIHASVPLGETFFVFGSYAETESDFTFIDNQGLLIPGDTDIQRLNLGAGLIVPMTNNSDLLLSGAYSDIDFDRFRFGATGDTSLSDLGDDPSDGYFVDLSWRAQLTNNVEGSLGARYTDIDDLDGFSLVGNVMYEFTPNIGVNLSLDAGDELFTWGLGGRYSF